MTIVLDASALIAMLRGERGATKVAGAIAGAHVGTVNYAEVVGHFIQAGMPAGQVDAMLDPLPLVIVPLDKALAQDVGRLRAIVEPAGPGLGSRCCLAVARRYRLPAWTSDVTWKAIADEVGVRVVTIR